MAGLVRERDGRARVPQAKGNGEARGSSIEDRVK